MNNSNARERMLWILVAFLAGALFAHLLPTASQSLDPTPAAQAQYVGTIDRPVALSADSFFVTSSQDGSRVNLWYFERKGSKSDSRVMHVTRASSESGPYLKN